MAYRDAVLGEPVTSTYAVEQGCATAPESAGYPAVDSTESATTVLFAEMGRSGTGPDERRRIRARIIELNLPFARRLAHRYRDRGQERADLEQVAALALVKAVDGFDPRLGKPFFGYLVPTVVGELKRHFRDKGWGVHVGRGLQERHLELARARGVLAQTLQRSPTVDELAGALHVGREEVLATWAAGNAYDVDSLNVRVSDGDTTERQDLLGGDDQDLVAVCDRLALHAALRQLPEREQHILARYFFGDATQEQIAGELGMSQMNVSRLLRRTLHQLREHLDGDAGIPRSPARRAGITSGTHGGRAVVTVGGELDERMAAELRDVLVDTAVRARPRHLVVDLRGVGAASRKTVGALVDGYRAGGHTGTTLVVVNIPAGLYGLLARLGVTRLFDCRPAEPPVARTATSASTPAGNAQSRRRPAGDRCGGDRPHSGRPPVQARRAHRPGVAADGGRRRSGGRRPAWAQRALAAVAQRCPGGRRGGGHPGRHGMPADRSRPPPPRQRSGLSGEGRPAALTSPRPRPP